MNSAEDLLANETQNIYELPINTEDIPENNLIVEALSTSDLKSYLKSAYNTENTLGGNRYKMELRSEKYSKGLKFKLGEHVKGKLKTGRL